MDPHDSAPASPAPDAPSGDHPDVVIVGGGIAGLALAGFLDAAGWSPTVVERTAAWERVGWGIGLWANGLAVLDRLGVAEAAVARGSIPKQFEIRNAADDRLATVELPDERAFLAIHRADLHAALRETVPSDAVRMDTTPATIEQDDDDVLVTYDDGRIDRADAVIGADGVGSSVRDLWFEDWTVEDAGTAVWSFWTDVATDEDASPAGGAADQLLPDGTVSYWGRGTEAFVTEIDDRGLVNVATTLPPEDTPSPPARDLLADVATELGGCFPSIVRAIPEGTTVFFDRNRTVHAERWHRDRVALIGDAAHAVHPISGMGAALALEDAYVLADELTSTDGIEAALAAFEARRRDRVANVKRTADIELATAFAESPLVTGARDALIRWTSSAEWFIERQLDDVLEDPLSSI